MHYNICGVINNPIWDGVSFQMFFFLKKIDDGYSSKI